MKIFLVGAGGFIGGRTAEYLASKGHRIVTHCRSEMGDLTEDMIPRDSRAVVNAAGKLGSPKTHMPDLMRSNALLPEMLARFCSNNSIHLIHLSTPGVAGLIPDSLEESPYSPWGDYELSKMEGEKAVLKTMPPSEGMCTVIRPDFVYGPGDLHKLPLFRQISKGWMPLVGRGEAKLRPTYCHDVSRAVEESLPEGTLKPGLYNIAGPQVVSVREFAQTIADALGKRVRFVGIPRLLFRLALKLGPLRPGALSKSRYRLMGEDHYVSIMRAESAGFQPETDVNKGVETTVSWYRSRGFLR